MLLTFQNHYLKLMLEMQVYQLHRCNYRASHSYLPNCKTYQNSQKIFFYPVCTGHFIYEPGYTLLRESYDSFFIIYIQKGMLHLKFNGKEETAVEGSFVFLDCYLPHSYDTDTGCEALDGITARPFYSAIV